MAATKKMTHPESSQTVEVPPGEVARYEAQGWSVKPQSAPVKKASPAPKK